ncbi:MAG: alpha/beta hydrolase [Pseudomonadota bacterium]
MADAIIGGRQFGYDRDCFAHPWSTPETVLLHHGYARNRGFWYEWIPALADHYDCVRMDMRGHGASSPLGADEAPTLESLAADTVALMDHLQIDKAHFVGESLAGVVGIWLGAHYADRFHSVVLLSTPVKVSDQGRADFSAGAPSWEQAFDTLSATEWARQTMHHRYDPNTTDPRYVDWVIEQAGNTPINSLRQYARLIEALDLTGGIPTVRVPSLLVVGGSKLAPPEQASFLASHIENATTEFIPSARHLVSYSHPHEVVGLARAFWKRIDLERIDRPSVDGVIST